MKQILMSPSLLKKEMEKRIDFMTCSKPNRSWFSKLTLSGVVMAMTSGCVYGPKAERKTPLDYLNGENYETSATGGIDHVVVPLIKRKEKSSRITGRVLQGEGISQIPLRNLRLGLFAREGSMIQEATTDNSGNFVFVGVFHNGQYRIQILSTKYVAEQSFDLTSYAVDNLVLRVP